jgi:hypothetical protein
MIGKYLLILMYLISIILYVFASSLSFFLLKSTTILISALLSHNDFRGCWLYIVRMAMNFSVIETSSYTEQNSLLTDSSSSTNL